MMVRRFLFLCAILLLAGCDPDARSLQYEDERNPYIRRALSQIQDQDYSAAADSYEEALAANPKLVQTHYDVGLLYQDKLSDPIAAMYHYSRYLKLAPDSPNRFTIQARLNNAQVQFAVTLPNSPVQNAEAFAKLQNDNQELTRARDEALKRLSELEARLNEIPPAKPDAVTSLPAQPPGPPASAVPGVAAIPPPSRIPPARTETTETPPLALGTEPSPSPRRNPRLSPVEIPSLIPELTGAKPIPRPTAVPADDAPAPAAAAAAPTPNPAGSRPESTATVPARIPSHPPGTTYTVQKGDSLWKIASHFFPGQVKEGIEKLRVANPSTLAQGKLLKPGQVLAIP